MELPITGTTEFMAKRTDLNPRASALDATAVLTERIDTKIAETEDMAVVIRRFSIFTVPDKLSSCLIPEQIPSARKQFVIGTKISSAI